MDQGPQDIARGVPEDPNAPATEYGGSMFVWLTASGAHLVHAADKNEAYRKVIQNRIEAGQTREEAEGWFKKNDELVEIESEIS